MDVNDFADILNLKHTPLGQSFFGHVYVKSNNRLALNAYNRQTFQLAASIDIPNPTAYFNNPVLLDKFNYYVFDVFNYKPPNNGDPILYWQEIADKNHTFTRFYFITSKVILYTSMLVEADIQALMGETIFAITMHKDRLETGELLKTSEGYEPKNPQTILINSETKNFLEKSIFSCSPKGIIIATINATEVNDFIMAEWCEDLSKKYTVIRLNNLNINNPKTISEFAYYHSKFRVIPQTQRYFGIFKETASTTEDALAIVQPGKNLGYNVCFEIARPCDTIKVGTSPDNKTWSFISYVSSSYEYHKLKVYLSINSHNFPNLKIDPIKLECIEKLPTTLSSQSDYNFPVIGFYDNFSIICLQKGKKKKVYNFMKEWGGIYGKDLILSFKHEKPTLVAKNDGSKNIIYDVLKIMSMPPDNLQFDSQWKFRITKDKINPVLIEVEGPEGKRFHHIPAFMMAIFLKEHVKVIKTKIGSKPETLGLCLFNASSEIKERVKPQLEEACKLLNIVPKFFIVR